MISFAKSFLTFDWPHMQNWSSDSGVVDIYADHNDAPGSRSHEPKKDNREFTKHIYRIKSR